MARIILPGATGGLVKLLRTVSVQAVAARTGHSEEVLEALQDLSDAVGIHVNLGTPLDDAAVKGYVAKLMGMWAGEEPTDGEIAEYLKELKKLHRPDAAQPAPGTATSTTAQTRQEPLFGRPLPGLGWWLLGVLTVIIAFALVTMSDATGWTKAAVILLPLGIWLSGTLSPRFREKGATRALIAAIVIAFILASTAGVQRIFAPLPAADPTATVPPAAATKGGTPNGEPPDAAKAAPERDRVKETKWAQDKSAAPAYLDAMKAVIQGPEGRKEDRFRAMFDQKLELAHGTFGTRIAADPGLTREWDELRRRRWNNSEPPSTWELRVAAAQQFFDENLAGTITEMPTGYDTSHFSALIENPGKRAGEIADEFDSRVRALESIEARARAITAPAPRPVDELLEERARDAADAAVRQEADALAARRRLLESQWELAFNEEALKHLGDILLPSGAPNNGVLSGRSLRAWQYSRLGPAIGSAETFATWFWTEQDPRYWEGLSTTESSYVAHGKAESANNAEKKDAEQRFLVRYGTEYGFTSLYDFFRVVVYANPNRFISHDAALATREAIEAAARRDSARMPREFQQPIWGRFSTPAPDLERQLKAWPHPRPEVDPATGERKLRPLIGVSKDEWVRMNMQ